MKKTPLILAALILSGCSAIFPNKTADTRAWSKASCSGGASWEDCKRTALRACPKGFDIANREENAITLERSFEFACNQ
jgi:uncharacterized protein YceK